jgi:hypothetical protein
MQTIAPLSTYYDGIWIFLSSHDLTVSDDDHVLGMYSKVNEAADI